MLFWIGLAVVALVLYQVRRWAWFHSLFPYSLQSPSVGLGVCGTGESENLIVSTEKYLDIKDEGIAVYKNRKIPILEFVEAYREERLDIKVNADLI